MDEQPAPPNMTAPVNATTRSSKKLFILFTVLVLAVLIITAVGAYKLSKPEPVIAPQPSAKVVAFSPRPSRLPIQTSTIKSQIIALSGDGLKIKTASGEAKTIPFDDKVYITKMDPKTNKITTSNDKSQIQATNSAVITVINENNEQKIISVNYTPFNVRVQ